MSIILKGIDMPISCEKCPLCYDYLCCSIDDSLHMFLYNRHPNCPLVEIPTPHGRLIDGDEFKSWVDDWYDCTDIGNIVESWIDERPTILEAEE